jgi:hypothetical protein
MVKEEALLPTDRVYAEQHKERNKEHERMKFMNQTGAAFSMTQNSFIGTNNVVASMN